jgi:hypothetical protein
LREAVEVAVEANRKRAEPYGRRIRGQMGRT